MTRALARPLLAALALSACAVPDPRDVTEDARPLAPPRWSTSTPAGTLALDDAWWSAFDDAVLASLVPEALAYNRDLRAAAARVEAARAEAVIAGADRLPAVDLSAGRDRGKRNFIGLPIPGSDDDVLTTRATTYTVSAGVSWEPDLWGRVAAAEGAALADLDATRADLYGAALAVAAETAKAWFGLVEARQQEDLAERTAAADRSIAERVRARYERGLRPAVDLRRLLAASATSEGRRLARRRATDAALRRLEVLLGRSPGDRVAAAEALPELPAPVPAGVPAELLRRRPDLHAAELRLLAADRRLEAARADLLPRVSLTGDLGVASDALGDVLERDLSVWSLALGVVQPLFDGGRRRAAVDRDHARALERWAEYEGAVLRAFADVEVALGAERALVDEERARRTAMLESREAERVIDGRYARGLVDVLELLDARRTALANESEWLAVRRAVLDARVDLVLALGGGFDARALAASGATTPEAVATAEHGRPVGATPGD